MSKEYLELQRQYRSALAKSQGVGQDAKIAFADKAKIMGEIRHMERTSAREGKVLNPVMRDGAIAVDVTETSSRRSLREEYVRKFDNKVPVKIENRREGSEFVGTLRSYHSKRLLGK